MKTKSVFVRFARAFAVCYIGFEIMGAIFAHTRGLIGTVPAAELAVGIIAIAATLALFMAVGLVIADVL